MGSSPRGRSRGETTVKLHLFNISGQERDNEANHLAAALPVRLPLGVQLVCERTFMARV